MASALSIIDRNSTRFCAGTQAFSAKETNRLARVPPESARLRSKWPRIAFCISSFDTPARTLSMLMRNSGTAPSPHFSSSSTTRWIIASTTGSRTIMCGSTLDAEISRPSDAAAQ